ncbi:MAG: biotin--[acetyl-CoA-carboxylase] ligase [Meiothermus sp.]|uniref:biotin--[acetyl-CoA-carboxylase] ligase n=1 Tax=Meiothermus sp. TaxID=1955249 RepID=UPI0025EDF9FB|nr:biotin--[acetyl-CoA-carboxylase] ligase [Meiothermus sp.]MCS7059296.1 biotin--[acetyl-CoA-carboxylase] ligase [Meiothermus sp.]MCS7195161.1 biotin--[acetyl-CoA-carboxylase] ligase [Meiothermus sp.]MCX7740972.1 biotin--[acetyl-CoA-carboxylase] ligase [Meiothermus sp.]MDW8091712.1 biotin--[acetyl-CoA-carboxylase] ligase [Meiothermus sp.]MDW8482116.1 biotin--[acetyl-CoA-carboxylase] ligase [Meiothermus sp.]
MLPLLDHLSGRYQSGQALAQRLGVSRTAVWKQALALRAQGYPVETQRGWGYRLAPGSPTPQALEALREGRFGAFYAYLGTVESTQEVLKGWALDGAEEGAVVLAERQLKGRGRRGRTWISGSGKSLTFSVLLRPTLPLSALALIPLVAGLALREAVGVGGLKWPNDLLAPDGRKLAGILLEAQVSGEEVAYVLLGVGLNVHQAPGLPPEAAALAEFVEVSRVEVLARFLSRLEARYAELHRNPQGFLLDYKALSCTLGRPVRVQTPQGEVRGVATDLSPDGSLVVEGQGQTCQIGAGDVELIGYAGGVP